MNPAHLCCLAALSLMVPVSSGQDRSPELEQLRKRAAESNERRLVTIRGELESFREAKSDDLMMKLAWRLHFLSGNDRQMGKPGVEANRLYAEVRGALMETPGHAEVFERRFLTQRADVLAGKRTWNHLHDTGMMMSLSLCHLPSAETMRVLGRMLEDNKGATPEDRFPNQPKEPLTIPSSAAQYALGALNGIGIDRPPTSEKPPRLPDDPVNIDTWREWWREVKEGKRTYRFQGSPVVHHYEGPAGG
jgi:hypothetical protein